MQAEALARCCSAKWLYQLPIKQYVHDKKVDMRWETDSEFEKRATKEIREGLLAALALDDRQQAFVLLAASERQLTPPLRAALETVGFENIAAANGTHGTPVYLYAYMKDKVTKKRKRLTE